MQGGIHLDTAKKENNGSVEIIFSSDSLILLGCLEGDPLLFYRVSHENNHDAEGPQAYKMKLGSPFPY